MRDHDDYAEDTDIIVQSAADGDWEDVEDEEQDDDEDDDDETSFTVDEIKAIFEPTIEKICALIEAQLTALPEISMIFLVGGFSASPYLEDRVRAKFHNDQRSVHRVAVAAESIVNGAVMSGIDARSMSTRCMRKTYGISMATIAEPEDPQANLRTMADGKTYCLSRFDAFVNVGDEIPPNHVVTKRYKADRLDLDLSINLYSAKTPHPRTIREPGVASVAILSIPLSQFQDFGAQGVEVRMFFGKTVMEMQAVDVKTGKIIGPIKLAFSEK